MLVWLYCSLQKKVIFRIIILVFPFCVIFVIREFLCEIAVWWRDNVAVWVESGVVSPKLSLEDRFPNPFYLPVLFIILCL